MATRKKETIPPGLKGKAREIWLAGLGALNLAGEEGGKLFQQLVERGRDQEKANAEMMGKAKERAQGLKENARETLGRIAAPIEDGLSSAMQRLGVPSRAEILKLTQRVEELTRQVARAKAAREPMPKTAAPAKPRTRPSAAKQEKAAPTGNA